jgi:pyridoxal biosynthesis lyase PdxS
MAVAKDLGVSTTWSGGCGNTVNKYALNFSAGGIATPADAALVRQLAHRRYSSAGILTDDPAARRSR